MGTATLLGLLAALLLGRAASEATGTIDVLIGGKVTLTPTVPADLRPLTNIEWRRETRLVCDWTSASASVHFYPAFRDRSQLDTDTAQLEMERVTAEDSGVYMLGLNMEDQPETFRVKVLEAVAKPIIHVSPLTCSHQSQSCQLTCEGGGPGAGPVAYSWRMDAGEWMERGQRIEIGRNASAVRHIYCGMANSVSSSHSDALLNPLHQAGLAGSTIAVVVVVLLLLCVCGAVLYKFRTQIMGLFNRNKDTKEEGPAAVPLQDNGGEPGDRQPQQQEE